MKFTILQKKLKEGLDVVERLSGKSLTLPILNNMLVSVQKNFLNLATTDLETGIRWWALAKIEETGEAVIPTKILSNLVNYLPDKPILFETKDKLLSVECDNYKTQINYFNRE